ncbi:hypothetical protein FEK35_03485 [Nocardia cyriacigeorgica]|uniref:Alkylmercury lyase n=1 Tax=Nocardia cyriacigeorgica TaxID=135487 RepID=A0A5R8PJS7_9NOCA|nr:alkylmercury lyase family protein [Nocardia cyriacigeorgica]TLG16606.1 hypothetical protein FEK35_03485 [Nocardia cyriacigeorgica]
MDQVRAEGNAPTMAELRDRFGLTEPELAAAMRDLDGAICVACQDVEHAGSRVFQDEPLSAPQPPVGELVYARPFATFANHYRITVDGEQRWFAECAVEACAISGQFPGKDVIVDSVCRQTGQPVRLVGRDGILVDYEPATLRVHLGYPLREMPHRVVGWCDYNSFFASEEAADQWRREHPGVNGVTRSPEQMALLITEVLGKGRLDYDYQPTFGLLGLARNRRRYGLTGSFWLPTPAMARDWKRRLGFFLRLRLA